MALTSGPIAHWAFNEAAGTTLVDGSGNGHDASFSDGVARIDDGIYSRALRLSSPTSGVTVPGAGLGPDDVTVSLWVRSVDAPAVGAVLVEKGVRGCTGPSFGLYVADGGIELRVMDVDAGPVGFTSPVSELWNGAWHHVSFTLAPLSGWAILTIEGHSAGSGLGWNIDYSNMTSDALTIGASAAATSCRPPSFVGDIDDVRLYERALDHEELGALEPPITTETVLSPKPGLVAWIDSCLQVKVDPSPLAGTVQIFELLSDGTEKAIGIGSTEWCSYPNPSPPTGTYLVRVRFETKGVRHLRARFVPGNPWQPSVSSVIDQPVGGIATRVVTQITPAMPGQPIDIEVGVTGRDIAMAGSVSLYETTAGSPVLVGSRPLDVPPGQPYGGTHFMLDGRPAGTYSFEARYAGTADVFEPSTAADSITIGDDLGATGPVTIDGGAAISADAWVSVDAPGPGAVNIRLSSDDAHWCQTNMLTPLDFNLTFNVCGGTDIDGVKQVYVQWQDGAGRWSASQSDTIVLDRGLPSASKPTSGFAAGSSVSFGKPSIRLGWSGADATTGVARYELAQSTDGHAYGTVSTTLTSPSITRGISPGHTYRFRVRPVDKAGNTGIWAYGTSLALSAVQESSWRIAWSGTWRSGASTGYWGGRARYATSSGAKATIRITGRSFAWVAPVGPTRGSARIYVNGALVRTVSLYATTSSARRVVFATSWPTSAPRTVVIRVSGTAGHPRVDLDALIWAN
jgi:hypothetical protein